MKSRAAVVKYALVTAVVTPVYSLEAGDRGGSTPDMTHLLCAGTRHSGVGGLARILSNAGLRVHQRAASLSAINAQLCGRVSERGFGEADVCEIVADDRHVARARRLLHQGVAPAVWADERSALLMEFWLTVDPSIFFLIGVGAPDFELAQYALAQGAPLQAAGVNAMLGGWRATAAKLLRFAAGHRDRCLLVDAERALAAPRALVGAVGDALPLLLSRIGGGREQPSAAERTLRALCRTFVEREASDLQVLFEEVRVMAAPVLPAEVRPRDDSAASSGVADLRYAQKAALEHRLTDRSLTELREEVERLYGMLKQREGEASHLRNVVEWRGREMEKAHEAIAGLKRELAGIERARQKRERDVQNLMATFDDQAVAALMDRLRRRRP